MTLTTSPKLENHEVTEYLGLVHGDAIMAVHLGRDILAGIRDIFGGRSKSYENQLKLGKENAITELKEEAEALGADAVISIDFDYESIRGTMLMVTVTGTAVKF